jgi:ketosteroid isomerase-like protein
MLTKLTPFLCTAVLLSLAACNSDGQSNGSNSQQANESSDQAAALEDVRRVESNWAQNILKKTPQELGGYYAVDAVVMEPGVAALQGLDEIRSSAANADGDRNKLQFNSEKLVVGKGGDIAYSRGTYHVEQTDPATGKVATRSGHYVTIYRKEPDGSWKAIEDIST